MDNFYFKDSRIYDALKYLAQIVLPACGTLYFSVANIWGLPYPQEVVGTITAIDAFLGVILGITKAQYDKAKIGGDINVKS